MDGMIIILNLVYYITYVQLIAIHNIGTCAQLHISNTYISKLLSILCECDNYITTFISTFTNNTQH